MMFVFIMMMIFGVGVADDYSVVLTGGSSPSLYCYARTTFDASFTIDYRWEWKANNDSPWAEMQSGSSNRIRLSLDHPIIRCTACASKGEESYNVISDALTIRGSVFQINSATVTGTANPGYFIVGIGEVNGQWTSNEELPSLDSFTFKKVYWGYSPNHAARANPLIIRSSPASTILPVAQ